MSYMSPEDRYLIFAALHAYHRLLLKEGALHIYFPKATADDIARCERLLDYYKPPMLAALKTRGVEPWKKYR